MRAILGLQIVTPLAMPLAPVYLAVAGWLMFKGFEERQRPVIAETPHEPRSARALHREQGPSALRYEGVQIRPPYRERQALGCRVA